MIEFAGPDVFAAITFACFVVAVVASFPLRRRVKFRIKRGLLPWALVMLLIISFNPVSMIVAGLMWGLAE